MMPALLAHLRCPACDAVDAWRVTTDAHAGDEVITGTLGCTRCDARAPIEGGIPRFVPRENYARSFGVQWHRHARAQLDAHTGGELSAARLAEATRWPTDLRGQRILEAGSGAGRFTGLLAATGAEVISFDYSTAVEVNRANHGVRPGLHVLQADLYAPPVRRAWFHKILCLGVLQHCPDPRGAFLRLCEHLAPGGEIVVDVYALRPRSLVHPKYLLRPLTTRLPPERLHAVVTSVVRALLPVKRWLSERPPLGPYLAYVIPVAYQRAWQAHLDALAPHLEELSILDTFDWYAPAHDHPQTLGQVRRWLADAGLQRAEASYGSNGIIARGVRR